MNIVLGNRDYETHTSSEGQELQAGLHSAGWVLSGRGYDDLHDAREIIARYDPDLIFVQDVRDWLPSSDIAYRHDGAFTHLEAIGEFRVPAFTVLKDAAGWHAMQSWCAAMIKAAGLVVYYHPHCVDAVADWSAVYPLIRTYHTVNTELIPSVMISTRKRGLVSGARGECYPIRNMAFEQAKYLDIETLPHPGYGNRWTYTPDYLATLTHYKTHVATASRYGFALRKIIESVACGCTPITDLPERDRLPEIDDALVRIGYGITRDQLRAVIDRAEAEWDPAERYLWAMKAQHYYDWRVMGQRLSSALMGQGALHVH